MAWARWWILQQAFYKIFEINNIEMYSTHDEGKSVVDERFIKKLKNKAFKHMAAVSKPVFL